MPKTCDHPINRTITTNHGTFCLECGKLRVKSSPSKAATQKQPVKAKASQPGASASPSLLTHHKQAVLKPTRKLKVTDLSA